MKEEIFYSIREITSNPSLNGKIDFGNKQIFFIENKSSVLHQKKMTQQLMMLGLLPESLTVSNQGIAHGSKNDPTFVDIKFGKEHFFTHIRIHQYDGEKVLGNRNFKPSLIAENKEISQVNILTGICLFGSQAAVGITDRGKEVSLTSPHDAESTTIDEYGVIDKIYIDKFVHPYEADTILRISSFINALTVNANVYLHVPKIEYYTYGLDLYKKGLIREKQVLQWFDEVDRRANGVTKLLDNRIKGKNKRHIVPLENVESYFRTNLQPDIGVARDLLSTNPLWKVLLSKVNVNSLSDIRNLNYMYPYLALSHESTLLAIENPEQNGIMIGIQKSDRIKTVGKGTIVGLYLHPHVIPKDGNEEDDKKYLYFFSNKNSGVIRSLVEVLQKNQNYE